MLGSQRRDVRLVLEPLPSLSRSDPHDTVSETNSLPNHAADGG